MHIGYPRGRYEALNITVTELIQSLYGFDAIVEGGPKWVQTDRYDIEAKSTGEVTGAERVKMISALLNDRFKLEVRQTEKEESGLALTIGKKAPQLEPAKEGERAGVRLDATGHVIFTQSGIQRLTGYLTSMWHTIVEDHTGLTGNFDFSLDTAAYTEDPPQRFPDRLRPAVEALGFHFESVKVKRTIVTIDHVERPGEN